MARKPQYAYWQSFIKDPKNKKLSIMEAKQKFLKEQQYREWHYPQTFTPSQGPPTAVYTAPGTDKLEGVGNSIIGFSTNTYAQLVIYANN